MQRRVNQFAVLLLVLLAASWVTAQYHDDKYITGGSVLYKVDGTSLAVTTIFDNGGTAYDMAMDTDNKSLWFVQSTPAGLYKVDVTTSTVTTVLQDALLGTARDMVVNQDGDLVFTTSTGLFKFANGVYSTLAMAPSTATNWYGGLEVDIDNGNYVIQAKNSPYALIAVNSIGAIATLASGGSPRYSITQDITTGDWYQGSFNSLYRLQQGTSSLVKMTLTGSGYYYALACDRASAANRRIISIHNNGSATTPLNYTDLATGVVTATTLNAAIYNYETEVYRGNNLCTAASGKPGRWTINLSFPNSPNTAYIVALSLTGVRPGVVLGDGRRINLRPDTLTVLTLNNAIPAIFNAGPIVLDANGEAKGWIDVSSLGKLSGARVWIGAALVGKAGIGTIADPVGLTFP